jgi:hypothetical protein
VSPASRAAAAALDDVRAFIGRFCALPTEHAYTATALWAAHAHVLDAFDSHAPADVPVARAGLGKPGRWKSSRCLCRGRCTRSTPPPPRHPV